MANGIRTLPIPILPTIPTNHIAFIPFSKFHAPYLHHALSISSIPTKPNTNNPFHPSTSPTSPITTLPISRFTNLYITHKYISPAILSCTYISLADLGAHPARALQFPPPPPHGPKCSQIHAVFLKIWQIRMLLPPPPPTPPPPQTFGTTS